MSSAAARAARSRASAASGTAACVHKPCHETTSKSGIPDSAIFLETKAQNTHEHAINLCPIFAERKIHRVLLVSSAMHMPRSIGAFRQSCPAVEYVAAPTDFRVTSGPPAPWYRHVIDPLPTPQSLADFTSVSHEYIGLLYYRLRGWL